MKSSALNRPLLTAASGFKICHPFSERHNSGIDLLYAYIVYDIVYCDLNKKPTADF